MMENLFEFLLKSSGILAIFYVVYLLFLEGETLFRENRRFLLFGVLCALIGPFISIPVYVEIEPTTALQLSSSTLTETGPATDPGIDFWYIASLVYWAGLAFWTVKFGLQLGSLRSTLRYAVKRKEEGKIKYLETDRHVAPFSFFNYIVYNPADFDRAELDSILAHEEAHCKQNHSIDILIGHLMAMILWINPISFLYRRMIRQNLEFLADASAADNIASKKSYQYTMLKVSGQQIPIAIINHFYNSLIKKRIVMLQKSNSKKANVLKTALVLPALALFLFSFNTTEVYIPGKEASTMNWLETDLNKQIKIQITKDTSDEELEKIKKDLAEDGVDFSYTIVRNDKKEIIEISIDVRSENAKGKNFSGSSVFENSGNPIDPVTMILDTDGNMMFMGNPGDMEVTKNAMQQHMTWIVEEDPEMSEEMKEKLEKEGVEIITIVEDVEEEKDREEKVLKIRVGKADGKSLHSTSDKKGENGRIIIKKVQGGDQEILEEKIFRIHADSLEIEGDHDGKMQKHIEVIRSKAGNEAKVIIMKDTDEDDLQIVEGGSFFYLDTNSGEKPLFIIDGKLVKEKELKALSPKEIESINVYKGEKAIEKYGKKAKDGAVEITTKKN